jgi:hypothetical protein
MKRCGAEGEGKRSKNIFGARHGAAGEIGFYPGGITDISRGLSDSDTPGSRTREESSSSPRDDRWSGLDFGFSTIRTWHRLAQLQEFCTELFEDRIRNVWHPSGMQNFIAF